MRYRGYCSDFGRSAFIGEPDPTALAAWQSITRVIQLAMAEMGDGRITPNGIHDFVVDEVSKDGFREQFSWYALGHAIGMDVHENPWICLLYTSDAADERSSVDLGGRRIIKKKKSRVTSDDRLT